MTMGMWPVDGSDFNVWATATPLTSPHRKIEHRCSDPTLRGLGEAVFCSGCRDDLVTLILLKNLCDSLLVIDNKDSLRCHVYDFLDAGGLRFYGALTGVVAGAGGATGAGCGAGAAAVAAAALRFLTVTR